MGWFYPSAILDDFSRYAIAWKLRTTMKANAVAGDLADWLEDKKIKHVRGAPWRLAGNKPLENVVCA